ncbi:MAG: photosystem II biogenesis protein Psp29 [Scytolyngbya sp. HA4215-MV1]|nr:photosystem II biogenesis protein Psp29 [Scytolyngbya sp. HA4215-MV1]
MNNVRTVSDTKRAFYNIHTRPIHSIYRRVVEELMVEMHLLLVNADFRYDPIYAFGVVSTFDRFMQGYQPDPDKESIFNALCQAMECDPQQYQRDASRLKDLANRLPGQEILAWLSQTTMVDGTEDLRQQVQTIANNPHFKYSRLFAIGVFSLLEQAAPEMVKDDAQRNDALKQICAALHLPDEKVQKDLELYRSNLEKLIQARIVLEDVLKADRKKREERAQAKGTSNTDSLSSDSSKDEAPSGS